MTADQDPNNWLRAAHLDTRARSALATSIYNALTSARKLADHRVLVYRCPKRCLLLDVLLLPDGLLIATPRYKLSPRVNEASSNEAGRRKHTEDGGRRWGAQAYFAQDAAGFSLNCDHVESHHLSQEAFELDMAAKRELVTIPA